jgi:two-component system, cell cycle response regulator DivK
LVKRVLIVEDSFDNRTIYADILRHAGYAVIEAENGARGVEEAQREMPDLILMDLSMPQMDGWKALEVLKQDGRTAVIPVLAVSAHVAINGDLERAVEAGFATYLTKPIEPKEVLREVESRIGAPVG